MVFGEVANWIHARFSPELKEGALEWLQKLPRYIVCEEVGGVTEKTHYHACFDSDVGIEAIKKRFQTLCKAQGLVSKRGQENAFYGGVKECTDMSYICKEGNFTASAGFTRDELEALRSEGETKFKKTPIVAQDISQEYIVIKPAKKSVSMRAQFVRYMEEEGWKKNFQINPENQEEQEDYLIKKLTHFWENAFTTPQGVVCVEHALFVFADDDVREYIERKNIQAIKKCLR